jgi:hypothetical protein
MLESVIAHEDATDDIPAGDEMDAELLLMVFWVIVVIALMLSTTSGRGPRAGDADFDARRRRRAAAHRG